MTPAGGSALSLSYTGTSNSQRTSIGSTTATSSAFGLASTLAGSTTSQYTYDPSGRLNSFTYGGTRYYYLYDGENNVIGWINSSGAQVASYSYDSYGNTTASGSASSYNPVRYQSGYQDPTGSYHFGARYYNPASGLWTQLDPSGQSPGYQYAGDNPVDNADPSGLYCYTLAPGEAGPPHCLPGPAPAGDPYIVDEPSEAVQPLIGPVPMYVPPAGPTGTPDLNNNAYVNYGLQALRGVLDSFACVDGTVPGAAGGAYAGFVLPGPGNVVLGIIGGGLGCGIGVLSSEWGGPPAL